MPIGTRRGKLSDAQRASIEKQLKERIAPKVLTKDGVPDIQSRFTPKARSGMSARLLNGEDVERYLQPMVDDVTSKKTKELNAQSERNRVAAEKKLDAKIDAVLGHLVTKIDVAVKSIKPAENGHTPTQEEIAAVIGPIFKNFETQFRNNLEAITKNPEEKPSETLMDFDEMMRAAVEKFAPKSTKSKYGGGGPKHFYDLLDVPGKTERYGPAPYKGYENKYVRVKTDGTGLEYVDIAVGGANVETTTVIATAGVAPNTVDIDLTQLPHPWLSIQMVIRNGAIQNKNKWSIAGNTLTLTGAVFTNDFQIQSTYA